MFTTMEKVHVMCWKLWSIVGIITIFTSGIPADSRFIMSTNLATWSQADMYCHRSRSALAILDVPDLQRIFDKDIKPTPGEKLWVGRYLGYSGIVSIEGCYHNMTMSWRRARTISNNYLVNCLSMCPDTTYIGLQNELCYCVDAIPGRAAPLPATSCQSRCPGEQSVSPQQYMTQCGRVDTNSVSLYRKVLNKDVTLDKNSPNIGECIAYNTGTRSWQPLECTLQRIFTCDRKPCPIPIQQCMLESTTTSTWFDGRLTCEGNGGFLATVNLTTSRFFDFRQTRGDGIYWTGLHRKQAIVWKYGNTNNDIIRSDKCVAVLKRQDGSWDWQLDWCNRNYSFVCLQEFTPVTEAPVTPPPTQRPKPRPTSTVRPTFRPTIFTTTTTAPPLTAAPSVTPKAQPVNDNDASSVTSFIYVHAISLLMCLYVFK